MPNGVDEIGAPELPRAYVALSQPSTVATLILTAALCQYDPGTEPWDVLHQAADEIREAMAKEQADVGTWLTTDCAHCDGIRSKRAMEAGDFSAAITTRMIVCPVCGNKRCPKAAHHDNACSGSNEPGQVGGAA